MQLPALITNYIKNLDTEAQDRLLTTKLMAYDLWNGEAGCLVGVARGYGDGQRRTEIVMEDLALWDGSLVGPNPDHPFGDWAYYARLPVVFNRLFSADPVGTTAAIRNYILELRASAIAATVEPLVLMNA